MEPNITEEKQIISIHLENMPKINFALAQKKLMPVQKLILKNETEEELTDLIVRISSSPELLLETTVNISALGPKASIDCIPDRMDLKKTDLYSLSEKATGFLSVEVYQGENLIAAKRNDTTFLTFDQWMGSATMPEMLASFVMPNVPAIATVIDNARPFMESWQGNSAFTGYQTDNPQTVRIQMAAIFSALQSQGINYCVPPASFEKEGQRIRLPQQIFETKLGTCIDLSLLYASCLEAIGLHPVVVLLKGHAFAGAWLTKETFPECIEEDYSSLSKRAAKNMNQICLVECTDMTAAAKIPSFDQAQDHALMKLENPQNFEMVIDIARCRYSDITPLPVITEKLSEEELEERLANGYNVPINTLVPQEYQVYSDVTLKDEMTQATRLQVWERNLLDLSLRNMLLNFRGNKNAVQLLMPELEPLEDVLSEGKDITIGAFPGDWEAKLTDGRIFEVNKEKSKVSEFAKQELNNQRVRTYYPEEVLHNQMLSLYREAKTGMEENGTNSLYLALGFLRWYETGVSEKARFAPIVLYPVEIVRKVSERSFRIRMRDEDPQINVTLLEMLRQNFGIQISGLDELPHTEKGLDLNKIFYIIRTAIMAQPRFDIEERAYIGIFSFRQFIMWNDLKNRIEDLKKNKLVASLMEGHLTWEPKDVFVEGAVLDSKDENANMAVPLSADSSQLQAICAAAKGESFVLHGPPGTGKSQTITNMIANALYQGKSVLFVADKMAALSVVQKRLEKVGLAPFCLELHSNKARKRDVLEQLQRTIELGNVASPNGYEARQMRMQEVKDELNAVVVSLHKPRSTGRTLFEMIGEYEQYHKLCAKEVPISAELLKSMTPENYVRAGELLEHCIAAAKDCGDVQNHPFALFESRVYTAMLRDTISTQLKTFSSLLQPLEESYVYLCEKIGFDQLGGYTSIGQVLAIMKKVLEVEHMTGSLLNYTGIVSLEGTMQNLVEQGKELKKTREGLLSRFSPAILTYDYQSALRRLKEAEESFVLFRGGKTKKVVDEVNFMMTNAKLAIGKDDLPELFLEVKKYQDLLSYIQEANPTLVSLMEGYWRGEQSDFDQMLTMYHNAMNLRQLAAKLTSSSQQRDAILRVLSELCIDHTTTVDQYQEVVQTYDAQYGDVINGENILSNEYGIRMDALHAEADWFASVRTHVMTWRNHISELRNWVGFLNAYDEAGNLGLDATLDAFRSGEVEEKELIPAFYASLNYRIVMLAIEAEPALSQFRGTKMVALIKDFESVENDLNKLLVQEMAAKLSAKLPQTGNQNLAASSEVNILKKAIKSGGRNLSIRKLFQSIPDLLHQMCPCMLMSPMSVTQYIDPSFKSFDLVIFDEASQLPTCEAVGAIARGREAIVVGDPKQLPPTSFFKTQMVEESFEESNLESLLDDCLALSVPQSHLLWHYRSKHESLIAYSNQAYYDSKLYTFPSPNAEVSQVIFVPVEGYYDRGKTKKNIAEAAAVVEELVRRAKDEDLRRDSVGVVTFSLVQQVLIEDMLEDRIAKEPELDVLFQSFPEPVFIKNLENVQGDERDVILFSVGYGPDENGKVTMNFGPLNADGGWRRLNVAITRSRKQMMIFSVLKPEQIDLSKTSSAGIIGLKGFLEYAARGSASLVAKAKNLTKRNMITEQWIADMLKNAGYKVRLGVGVSRYKIDIAVVHPDHETEYILGIMCDGEMYSSTGTARDRNILQESILRGLGWEIYRVWILDWLDDPMAELEKLMEAIDKSIAKAQGLLAEETCEDMEPKKQDEDEIVLTSVDDTNLEAEDSVAERTAVMEKIGSDQTSEASKYEKVSTNLNDNRQIYQAATLNSSYEAETFYRNVIAIKKLINQVLEVEAPISKKMLLKRVISCFGINKVSPKVQATFDEVLATIPHQPQLSFEHEFIWRDDQIIEDYRVYRIPQNPEEKRAFEDITVDEISNAVYGIIKEQFSMTQNDLVKETAKLFGYLRSGEQMQQQILAALDLAIARELVRLSDDGLRVLTKD